MRKKDFISNLIFYGEIQHLFSAWIYLRLCFEMKTSNVLTLTFCGVVRHWTSQIRVINNNWQYKQETLLQSVFKFDIKSEIQLAAPLTPVTTLSLSS